MVEHNGNFYACDHFVDEEHCLGNILKTPLINLLESSSQKAFGQNKRTTLTNYCLKCDVLGLCNGGCPKDRFIKTPDGQGGLNYLCEGYKYFFHHCQPFIKALSDQWQLQNQNRSKNISEKIGRNAPCPCGSGRKYKKCCMRA